VGTWVQASPPRLRGGSGWGRRFLQFLPDRFNDLIEVLIGQRGDHAHYVPTASFEVIRLPLVALRIFVKLAIDLDDESRRQTGEVCKVRPDWDLPSELVSSYVPMPKSKPDATLGTGHVAPELSGADGLRRGHACTLASQPRKGNVGC